MKINTERNSIFLVHNSNPKCFWIKEYWIKYLLCYRTSSFYISAQMRFLDKTFANIGKSHNCLWPSMVMVWPTKDKTQHSSYRKCRGAD